MFNKILELAKKNLSIILFFTFLLFIFASFWYNNSQDSKNAKELLDYAKSSIEEIDFSLNSIATKSITVQDSETALDAEITDLSNFSSKLQRFAALIPDKNTDSTSQQMVTNLRNFYLSLKKDTIDNFLEKMQVRRDLIQDYKDYGQLQILIASGTKSDIKKSVESGNRVLDFEKKYLFLINDSKTQSNQQKNITSDKEKLEKLISALESLSDDQKLNSDQKSSADSIFNNLWPVQNPIFPKIAIEDLKSKKFNDNVNILQNSVNAVVNKFNIE